MRKGVQKFMQGSVWYTQTGALLRRYGVESNDLVRRRDDNFYNQIGTKLDRQTSH